MWILRLAAFLVFGIGSGNGAKFLLTAPEKPHYDSKFTVTVSAFEVYSKESISLEFKGVRDNSRLLKSTVIDFEYDGVQTWTVEFPWAQMEKLKESAVSLVMSTMFTEEKKTLYFSKSTGYIFIQTDKPLYTPRQTVKFRVIAVDEYQRLAKYPLRVDIRNEKMIIVDRMRYSAEDAFKGQEFELPKETPPGIWTISASFEGISNVQSSTHSVSFEVKEYVLPRFSASIEISNDVITKAIHWITITVTAKYVYGQRAMGSLEMLLGVWDTEKGLELLPGKYAGKLTNGVYKKDIRISKLIPMEMIVRANKRLYINVNVTEEGTQENYTIVDTSTFIAHPYYDINYTPSKMHFKPGFPYTLYTQVRARSGRPASWLKLWIVAEYFDAAGKRIETQNGYGDLDNDGQAKHDYNIPKKAAKIKFKTYVLDFKAGSNNIAEWEVSALKSPNAQFIHVSLAKPVKKYRDGLIKLRYTPPNPMEPITRISVLILARGQIVLSKSVVRSTDKHSTVAIPRRLYSEISPSMRIVASFYHMGDKGEEFVIDSLQVDTDPVCLEELSLRRPGGIFSSPLPKKPKDKYKLLVKGGPSMHVGMVAVDTAIFLLNNAHTLTRKSMFQQLGSHDQGTGSGDGRNMKEVFKNSGLLYMFIDSDETDDPRSSAIHSSRVRGNLLFGNLDKEFTLNVGDNARSGKGQLGSFINEAPPQIARKYFPESWLFEEYVLPKSGNMELDLTLPDSITTWSFLAVGLSSTRGVCVSSRLEQKVQKMFFVDVRLPYKVTRLEEVKVRIAIYNYHTQPVTVKAVVSGSDGLCFSSNRFRGKNQNGTEFKLTIGKKTTKSEEIKVIPLTNGDLTLRVDVFNMIERDIVERQIHVVAEGLRLRKTLTFVLDPEAKHASYNKPNRRGLVMLADTSTIKNMVNMKLKTQKTNIDLAMPVEVIRGTENCRISAFGDLMGDIINHAVIKSKNLMDQTVQNAEEVLGELGPTVHALLYANKSGLMDAALKKRARRFVTHGVTRLLKYRKEQAFGLTPESPEGTWLTTVVLKTLCHAKSLAFIDKQLLIDHGFFWLLGQVTENQTLIEKDWRLAKDSWDYQVMLSAEVLIALLECGKSEFEEHSSLMYDMAYFLEDNIESIEEPMVLAKVAYALTLFDKGSEATDRAITKLDSISKRNPQGQVYWSSEDVTNENKRVPFWYRKGVKASAIEATAFALLVFLKHPKSDVDAIADWLVSQRNHHGMFISALDSMAAIQALSSYSLVKTGLKVDLSCNVTSKKTREYSHSFKFTEKNAIRPESWNNVPVGHSLEVLTKGQGLGQMQVNVEYNVPIDPNQKCPFNVTIELKGTEVNFYTNMKDDPLCMSCSWGCRLKVDNTAMNNCTGNDTAINCTDSTNSTDTTSSPMETAPKPEILTAPPNEQSRTGGKARRTRSVRDHSAASRRSICLRVCLRHLESGFAGHTRVEVNMLTGYLPVDSDIERLKDQEDILDAWIVHETDSLMVLFKQIDNEDETCFGFRAVDHEEVGRPAPATVLVTEIGNPAPSCALEYHPPSGQESLQVYCADFSHMNQGECRCYSGLCSSCAPLTSTEVMHYKDALDLVCASDIGYQLQVSRVQDMNQWVKIDAKVLSVNKTGTHRIKAQDTIKMISPSSCNCPTFFGSGKDVLYMISADVEKMVDRYGKTVHNYLLDEQSSFLRVADPHNPDKTPKSRFGRPQPTVDHVYLEQAFKQCSP